jgi:hypothetical protein
MLSREGLSLSHGHQGASLDSHLGRLSSLWSFLQVLCHDLLNLQFLLQISMSWIIWFSWSRLQGSV